MTSLIKGRSGVGVAVGVRGAIASGSTQRREALPPRNDLQRRVATRCDSG